MVDAQTIPLIRSEEEYMALTAEAHMLVELDPDRESEAGQRLRAILVAIGRWTLLKMERPLSPGDAGDA